MSTASGTDQGSGATVLRALRWTCLAGVPLLLCVWAVRAPNRIHYDNALNLQYGQLLIDGKVPYVDFVDTNPPLIMYVNAIPAYVARRLGLNPITVFSLCVVAVVTWSMVVMHAQLKRGLPSHQGLGPLSLVSLWGGFNLLMWIAGPFGQREHLFVLLYVPFLLLRWRRWSGAAVRPVPAILVAVAAAVGVCLKPYFALPALAVEAWALLVARRPAALAQPEIAAFVATGVVYLVHFLLLPAAARAQLVGRWLPLLWRGYAVYGLPWTDTLNKTAIACMLVGIIGLVAVRLFRRSSVGTLIGMVATFTVGAVAGYLIQRKGWPYHQIPSIAGAALCVGVLALAIDGTASVRAASTWPLKVLRAAVVAVPVTFLVVIIATTWRLGQFDSEHGLRTFGPLMEAYTREGEPVLFLSTSVQPAYPAILQAHRQPGSRYLWLFPIPMLVGGTSPGADAPAEERRFLSELTEDIARRRPPLIFVGDTAFCQGCPRGFNLARYLEAAGPLQLIRRNYQEMGAVGGFTPFVLRERVTRGEAR